MISKMFSPSFEMFGSLRVFSYAFHLAEHYF